MKALVLFLTLAVYTVRAHAADNLVVNGDFAANTLAPWISAGMTSTIAGSCMLKGISSIEQTVTTKVGARYYIAASASSGTSGTGFTQFVMSATPTAGGPEDSIYVFPSRGNGFQRYSRVFTATTDSTRIALAMTLDTSAILLDNIVLYELVVPSRFAGVYTGTVGIALKSSNGAHTRSMTTASTEIDDDGRVILLEGTSRVHAGIIFDDATSDFFFDGLDNTPPVVDARGGNLSISFGEELKPSLDGGDIGTAASRKLNFKLRRQSR